MPGEAFCEYYLHPDRTLMPAAVQLGALLYIPALQGREPDGRLPAGGFAAQCRQALTNLKALLQQAGASLGEVAHVTVYFRDAALRPTLNEVWLEFYPDASDRPPHIYIPADLPPGVEAQLQVLAFPGAARKVLEIPGLQHQDPMAMGDLMVGLVFSSRLFGTEAFTGRSASGPDEQAAMVLAHARTLMQQAGSDLSDVQQVTAFVTDASLEPALHQAWQRAFPAGDGPDLHVLRARLGGPPSIRIAITGAV